MKAKSLLLLFLLLGMLPKQAQAQSEDVDLITLNPCLPADDKLPEEAARLLRTKLTEIITRNGIADDEYITRFILTARINITSKDIVPGPPQRVSQKMDITLMIGDIEADKLYATLTIPAMGIGTNETKSYLSAINRIKAADSRVGAFVEEGKQKIMAYYEAHGQEIVAEAARLADAQRYEDALVLLASVPNVCKNVYQKCSELASDIYYKWINAEAASHLHQAQTIWAGSPNRQGADGALEHIAQINFAAECLPQAQELAEQIKQQLMKEDQREWEFKLQQYEDAIEREKRQWEQQVQAQQHAHEEAMEREKRQWEQQVQAQQYAHEEAMAREAREAANQRLIIKACRDIAVERAKNQPKTINLNRIYIW